MIPKIRIFYFLTAISLFFYILYRAVHLSFVHDESLTYSILFGNKVYEESANNHLLNTALMRFILNITKRDDEILLRLPNVLIFILYFFSAYKIADRLLKTSLKISAYLLLLLNPFVLDFFSLARGYGLSLGLMMGSIYFLLKIADNHKSLLYNTLFAVCSIGAVYANFTLLIFYLAAISFWGLIQLYQQGFKMFLKIIPLSILAIHSVILYFLLPFLFMLKNKGGLYAGSNEGMIKSIAESNILCLFYEPNIVISPLFLNSLLILIILVFIMSLIVLFVKIKNQNFTIPFPFLLLMCLFIPYLQHKFMGILYPIERTALFYYPLWILCFVFTDFNKIAFQKIHSFIVSVLTLMIVFNFIKTANLTHTHTWYYDTHTKEVMLSLKSLKEENKLSDTTKMGVTWLFEPATNVYYRPKLQYNWLSVSSLTNSLSDTNDIKQYKLFYVTDEDGQKDIFKKNYEIIKTYSDTKTMFLMKKE